MPEAGSVRVLRLEEVDVTCDAALDMPSRSRHLFAGIGHIGIINHFAIELWLQRARVAGARVGGCNLLNRRVELVIQMRMEPDSDLPRALTRTYPSVWERKITKDTALGEIEPPSAWKYNHFPLDSFTIISQTTTCNKTAYYVHHT